VLLAASLPVVAERDAPLCAVVSACVEPLRLVLNVPAARLDVLEAGTLTRSYRVAVGTADHRTPIGAFQVDRVVWNPWWVPPPFEWARTMKGTRTIRLPRPIPLSVLYKRIEVREGRLMLHPDPYGLAPIEREDVISVLAVAGVPTADVDPVVIDAALKLSDLETVPVFLRDLQGPVPP
jgi:hypothetical protein